MGKKRLRTKTISKGKHTSMARGTTQAVRAARTSLDALAGKTAAWRKGLNPWLTVETRTVEGQKNNKPFVRVRANDYWGKPTAGYMIGKDPKEAANAAG